MGQELSQRWHLLLCAAVLLLAVCHVHAEEYAGDHGRQKNPQAVAEINAGTRDVAYAAWWGFDASDATPCLQAAIDSGAKKLIVSNMGRDWIITPITLRSDQEIFFEPGVVVTAKKGAFHGTHDSLFKAMDASNITIGGYGATLRMHKPDYMSKAYRKAEWRSGIYLDSCTNVLIYGLTIRDTGGDGVYLGSTGRGYGDAITIRDVIFDNNYRQGISVISAQNLLIENCVLKDTSGTGPAAGIDLEPDGPTNRMINVIVRNCVFENNQGPGFTISMTKLGPESKDVSILFENCHIRSSAFLEEQHGRGIEISGPTSGGPGGSIEIRNCHTENTQTYGARIFDLSASTAAIRFVNCTWNDVANGRLPKWYYDLPNVPIIIWCRQNSERGPGGVAFIDCMVVDDEDRPFMIYRSTAEQMPPLTDVKGNFTVRNPHGVRMDLGSDLDRVNLKINQATGDAH